MASKSDLNTYFKNETKINTQGKNFIAKHNNIPPY